MLAPSGASCAATFPLVPLALPFLISRGAVTVLKCVVRLLFSESLAVASGSACESPQPDTEGPCDVGFQPPPHAMSQLAFGKCQAQP